MSRINFKNALLYKFKLVARVNNIRPVNTSGPHVINESRYQPQEKCLKLSEHMSLIKTSAYQFRMGEALQEFSHKL